MTNEYLYGEDVEVPEIPNYIIMRRVAILNDRLEELLDTPYQERDMVRVTKTIKAIKFWESINGEDN